jgi:NDP-sugar pyrophosphorylase family protein
MMKAVILAGGMGKRMRPLTEHTPKAILPLKGRPIIDLILENLGNAGITRFIIVTGYLGEQIREHLRKKDITFVEQEKPIGSGDALKCAISLVEEDFIVSASDTILPVNHIKKLISLHQREKSDATVTLKKLSAREMMESSTVLLQGNSIKGIVEKPNKEEILSDLSACPFYIFNEKIKEYLPRIRKSRRGEYELTGVIQLMVEDGLKVKGLLTGKWIHITKPEDLRGLT